MVFWAQKGDLIHGKIGSVWKLPHNVDEVSHHLETRHGILVELLKGDFGRPKSLAATIAELLWYVLRRGIWLEFRL